MQKKNFGWFREATASFSNREKTFAKFLHIYIGVSFTVVYFVFPQYCFWLKWNFIKFHEIAQMSFSACSQVKGEWCFGKK